jgi:hypothetical protein
MPLSHEHVRSKILAKIKTYMLTRADYFLIFAMRYPVYHQLFGSEFHLKFEIPPMLPPVKEITFVRLLEQSFNLQSDLYLLSSLLSNISIEYYFIQYVGK